jgi:hypothetical protein
MERPQMLTQIASRYLGTKDAAAYVRFSPRTLEKMRCVGGGPRYLKRGKKVLYAVEDLDAWLRVDARSSTSETRAA